MKRKQDLQEYADGSVVLQNTVDIEPILKANRDEFNSHSQKARVSSTASKGGLRKVASIPIDTLMALGERGVAMINNDTEELKKFLNQNPQFRTSRGRL